MIINGQRYEAEPAVEAYVKDLQAMLREESEENCELKAENFTLKAENARLEEGYQKSVGVIAATDCVECKDKVYRKAYNDVMKIRANIQEIIEDVRKKDGGAENETN